MSTPPVPAKPPLPSIPPALPHLPPPAIVLRNLDDKAARRPAVEVLREVSWEGPALDPDALAAAEFLALL